MQVDIDLKPYNTFGISAKAENFLELRTKEEAINFFKDTGLSEKPFLIIGGGSNILLTKDFNGLVIKNSILGIETVKEESEDIYLKVGAGENWHQFVLHSIKKGFYGIENLSLIPGCVGASPMQNIGAYGVEVKDTINKVFAIEISTGKEIIFNNKDCDFGYRTSVFKTVHKGKYFIYAVEFILSKKASFKLSYGAIKSQLEDSGVSLENLSNKDVSEAVIAIRSSKLPDPKEIGNAGSFFKNPVVDKEIYHELKKKFIDIPAYEQKDGTYKLAAGWLIENAGWKGFRERDFGVHSKQALVLVNYGNSEGKDILNLSNKIIESIKNKYAISLEREVNII